MQHRQYQYYQRLGISEFFISDIYVKPGCSWTPAISQLASELYCYEVSSEFKTAFVGDVMVEMSRHLSASQFNVESFCAFTKDKTTQGHHRLGKTTRWEPSLFSIRKYIRYKAFKCGEISEFYIFM